MNMFNFKSSDTRFAFIQGDNSVLVYRLQGKNIKMVLSFALEKINLSLEEIKKQYPEIIKSTNLWILSGSRAEILTADKAPLTKQEMFEYAKWKIQDMITLPMQDIVYDILTNNSIKQPYFSKFLTAVVVKRTVRDEILTSFRNHKIPLQAIDTMQTAIRDMFVMLDESNNKPIAFLNLTEKGAQVSIYLEGGLILSRHIDLSKFNEEVLSEEDLNSIFEKLTLEIQRNLDFLDRQHSITEFEYMLFSMPKTESFKKLQIQLCEYFSIKALDNLTKLPSFEYEENIPIEAIASFMRGNKVSEVINLMPVEVAETSLKHDAKRILMFLSMAGFIMAIGGGVYEYRHRTLSQENEQIKVEIEKLNTDIQKLKSVPFTVEPNLQKDITSLIQTKDMLLKLQAGSQNDKNSLFPQFMYEVGAASLASNVFLSSIEFTKNGVMLKGYCLDKKTFSQFLNKLQQANSLNGKSLRSISMSENSENNRFDFVISSQESSGTLGGKP